MDVASTFAVSVAPPPFQKEVDEARRDTQARVSIPQLNESHGTKAQTHIGDRRGNTDGENSLLVAQRQGLLDADDDIVVDENGQRKRRRRGGHHNEAEDDAGYKEQGGDGYGFDEREYAQDLDGPPPEQDESSVEPIKSGYDPITGFYLIPATRFHHARKVLLRFREQNVHFLERFSDKTTAVGLINFALCRHYGSIIPHCRLGQVVERRA